MMRPTSPANNQPAEPTSPVSNQPAVLVTTAEQDDESIDAALRQSKEFTNMTVQVDILVRQMALLKESVDLLCSTCSKYNDIMGHFQNILNILNNNWCTCSKKTQP